MLGDIDDQAQVALDHDLAGIEVALANPPGQRRLFFRSQQRIGT